MAAPRQPGQTGRAAALALPVGVHQEGGGLVDFVVQPKRTKTADGQPVEEPRRRAKELTNLLNSWMASVHAPAKLHERGRLYVAYSSSSLGPRPDPEAPYGIGLTATPAEYCYPVWDPVDYSRMLRMHVARRIPVEIAEKSSAFSPTGSTRMYWWITSRPGPLRPIRSRWA